MELWLTFLAQVAHPLLVKFRFGEYRGRLLGKFGYIDDHADQVAGHSLLQQMNARVGHDSDPLPPSQARRGLASQFSQAGSRILKARHLRAR